MRRILAAVTIVAVLGALIASVKSASRESPVEVDTYRVSEATVQDSILASGNLTFSREIQLRPEVTGKVKSLHVDVGQIVEKDEFLMSLDPSDHQAEVDQVTSSLAIRRIEIERMEELLSEFRRRIARQQQMHERGFIDDESYRRLESEKKVLEIDVEAARERYRQDQALMAQSMERLAKTRFHAPMAGLITRIDVAEGETVVAGATNMIGSSLMTIADPDSYVAQVRVDEADIASVSIGQEVQVFAAAMPSTPALGTVSSVGLAANQDVQGRGLFYEVEVSLSDFSRIFPGMSCRAEIVIGQSQSDMTVPIAAVSGEDDDHFVWVVLDGKAWRRPVSLGLASDTRQIIELGIDGEDIVIVGPARSLRQLSDGASIKMDRN